MTERDDERARAPARIGPTDARLTSGIADDPEPGESARGATEDSDGGAPSSPAWGRSARTVLAGILLVGFATYLAVPAESEAGLRWYLLVAGLGLALWGFATWPRRGNVS